MDSLSLPAALARLDALQAELDAMRPLDADALGRAMQRLRLEWTYHSNAIEGNSLTYGETRALLMHGVTAHGKPLKDHLDIRRHREVIEFVEAFVRGDEPVRVDLVKEIHLRLMGDEYEITVELPDGSRDRRTMRGGAYKEQPNNVRTETGETHYYADPLEVPARMAELVEWLTGDEAAELHPVVRAALFHHRFVEIHPFPDGNGRSARVLMNLLLMRAGYVPAVLRQEQRPAYYGALSEADGGGTEPIIAFVAGELVETMELYLRAVKGEPDPDAFSRRVALLRREVETAAAPDERIDVDRRKMIADEFVIPLIEEISRRVSELRPMFGRLEHLVPVVNTRGDQSFSEAGTFALRDGAWVSFSPFWTLKGLKTQPSFDIRIGLDGRLGDTYLDLSVRPEGRWIFGSNALPGKRHVQEVSDSVLAPVVARIEEAVRGR